MAQIEEERPAEGEEESRDEEGPATENLDEDPAYDPEDPGLKDIKGG